MAQQVGIGMVGIEFSWHLFVVTAANLDAFEFSDLVVNLALDWFLLGVDYRIALRRQLLGAKHMKPSTRRDPVAG